MRLRVLTAVAVLTGVTLVLTAQSQLYDSNFVVLWEATALLAGDHPYRDFFEWGAPLAVCLSAAMQIAVGYRLIGEFLIQWTFIAAGVVLAFHLGLQLTKSSGALLAVLPVTLVILAYTPTYHYSKLFFFPLSLWLAWRYLERPGARRGAVFGAMTAVAFLFRHDYGIYVGALAVLTFALTRIAVPETRTAGSALRDAAAYGAAVALVLAPWLLIVQMNEGFPEYVRMRAVLFEGSAEGPVYAALLRMNPVQMVTSWLRAPASAAAAHNGVLWLELIGLVLPMVLVGSAGRLMWRHARTSAPIPIEAWRMGIAGTFLAIIASALFREPTYVVVAAPMLAAFGARFLTAASPLARAVAIAVLVLTTTAAVIWTREQSLLLHPAEIPRQLAKAGRQLFVSPPLPAESNGEPSPIMQYLRDCSVPGDRLLVTGSNPFQISYYARRSIAGGHVYWRQGWRRDPVHERQSLEMLQRQSVPFAMSTNDPVLEDFKKYPAIHAYLAANYVQLDDRGRLLVDRRRQPVGTFTPLGFPCFR